MVVMILVMMVKDDVMLVIVMMKMIMVFNSNDVCVCVFCAACPQSPRSGEELKALARDLSEEKGRFLQELRAQVLKQLGQDECVCVERVVGMATDTFTHRTRVMMERRGMDSTSGS